MTHHLLASPVCTRRTALCAGLVAGLATLVASGCASAPPPAPPARPPAFTPAQQAALRELHFAEESDASWSLDLGARLAFGIDATVVSDDEASALARVAKVLLGVGIDRLTVEGHTDNQGSEVYNQRLSERRAESVAGVLVTNGFVLDHITRRGFGAGRPVASNTTPAGRVQNRRAVLIVPSV